MRFVTFFLFVALSSAQAPKSGTGTPGPAGPPGSGAQTPATSAPICGNGAANGTQVCEAAPIITAIGNTPVPNATNSAGINGATVAPSIPVTATDNLGRITTAPAGTAYVAPSLTSAQSTAGPFTAKALASVLQVDQYGSIAATNTACAGAACSVFLPPTYTTSDALAGAAYGSSGVPIPYVDGFYAQSNQANLAIQYFYNPGGAIPPRSAVSSQHYYYWMTSPFGDVATHSFPHVLGDYRNCNAYGIGANYSTSQYSNKTNWECDSQNSFFYAAGQKTPHNVVTRAFGAGDLAVYTTDAGTSGGITAFQDTSNALGDHRIYENPAVWAGNITAITGNQLSISRTSPGGSDAPGEKRVLIDLTKAATNTLSSLTSSTSGPGTATFGSSVTASTGIGTGNAAITQATSATSPGSQTVAITTTTGSFSTGQVCVSDIGSQELVAATFSGANMTATFLFPHPSGFTVAQGGLACHAMEYVADQYRGASFSQSITYGEIPALTSTVRQTRGIISNTATTASVWTNDNQQWSAYQGRESINGTAAGGSPTAYSCASNVATAYLANSNTIVKGTNITVSGSPGSTFDATNVAVSATQAQTGVTGAWVSYPKTCTNTGGWTIKDNTATNTPTFFFTSYSLTSNVATVVADNGGGNLFNVFANGHSITVSGTGTALDGTFTMSGFAGLNISYAVTAANISSTPVSGTLTDLDSTAIVIYPAAITTQVATPSTGIGASAVLTVQTVDSAFAVSDSVELEHGPTLTIHPSPTVQTQQYMQSATNNGDAGVVYNGLVSFGAAQGGHGSAGHSVIFNSDPNFYTGTAGTNPLPFTQYYARGGSQFALYVEKPSTLSKGIFFEPPQGICDLTQNLFQYFLTASGAGGTTDSIYHNCANREWQISAGSSNYQFLPGVVTLPAAVTVTSLKIGSASVLPNLSGTTGSIGGGALLAGACTSGTVAVTGSTTAMAVSASPVTYPGDGNYWLAYVSTAGTVTVKVCGAVAGTPTASAYNVRVSQ